MESRKQAASLPSRRSPGRIFSSSLSRLMSRSRSRGHRSRVVDAEIEQAVYEQPSGQEFKRQVVDPLRVCR